MRQVLPPPTPAAAPAWRVPARDVVVVVGCFVLLGVVCGVLWAWLVTPAEFTKLEAGGAMSEDDLGRQFNADGWYVVVGALAGLAAGIALTAWRSRDPLLTSVLVLAGSLAAAALMAVVGWGLGPPDPGPALAEAPLGATVPEDLIVDTVVAYLAWPVGALAGSLFVLLGRPPEPAPDAPPTA